MQPERLEDCTGTRANEEHRDSQEMRAMITGHQINVHT